MIVLGIDPGSRRCGYAAIARVGGRLEARESGVLVPGDRPIAERLALLWEALSEVIERTRPAAVSIESAFCGTSPRSALVLGQARGIALGAAARAGLPVFEYAPAAVKRSFTGSGRAGKAQMVRTARQILGVDARLADEADAIAVAVCHLFSCAVSGIPLAPSPSTTRPPRGRCARGAGSRSAQAVARLRPSLRRYGAAG